MLTAHGPVAVTHITRTPQVQTTCECSGLLGLPGMQFPASPGQSCPAGASLNCTQQTVYVNSTQTQNEILKAQNITAESVAPIQYGQPVEKDVPSEMTIDNYFIENCSSQVNTPGYQVQTAFQTSSGITISQGVTHTSSESVSVGFKFTPAFSASGRFSLTDGSSSSTATNSTSGTTITITKSGTEAVQPNTALMIQLEVWPMRYTVPFTTSVTINGALSNGQNLSDLFSSAQLTFPIAGTLTADNSSDGAVVPFNPPFDKSKCPTAAIGATFATSGHFIPDQGTRLLRLK
jgi:hypothetical protein